MRIAALRKTAASSRRDELRQARAAAQALRIACPHAAVVHVELAFQELSGLSHTPQAFSVYPPAKAHFVYACPFGDCDGVYDLNEVALAALKSGQRRARGTLTCTGHRSGRGSSNELCDLAVKYSIVVRREDHESRQQG
jgi:hypothetical protein